MPELPETETIARDLDAAISGRKIRKVSVSKRDVLREVSARTLSKRLQDATILRSWRRAKLVIIDLDNGDLALLPLFLAQVGHASGRLDLAGNVEKADLLRMRVVERMNRLGGRLQQDRATLFRKIRLSFRR